MKKTILAIVLTLSTLLGFTQSPDFTVNVYQVDILQYNTISEEFTLYKTFYPENVQVTKQGNIFSVSNQDQSNYRIDEALKSEDPRCVNFTATDKDNEMIGLQFCLYQDEKRATMTALYLEKMVVIYYLRP